CAARGKCRCHYGCPTVKNDGHARVGAGQVAAFIVDDRYRPTLNGPLATDPDTRSRLWLRHSRGSLRAPDSAPIRVKLHYRIVVPVHHDVGGGRGGEHVLARGAALAA